MNYFNKVMVIILGGLALLGSSSTIQARRGGGFGAGFGGGLVGGFVGSSIANSYSRPYYDYGPSYVEPVYVSRPSSTTVVNTSSSNPRSISIAELNELKSDLRETRRENDMLKEQVEHLRTKNRDLKKRLQKAQDRLIEIQAPDHASAKVSVR